MRQVCVMSLRLFNLYMSDVIRKMKAKGADVYIGLNKETCLLIVRISTELLINCVGDQG